MILQVTAVLLAAAVLIGWLAGPPGHFRPLGSIAAALSLLLCIGSSAALFAAGVWGAGGGSTGWAFDLGAPLGGASLHLDPLSGLFLAIGFGAAAPALLAAAAPGIRRPRLPAAMALALLGMEVIVTADHLLVLLAGWEALGVAFYLLAGYDRASSGRARASVVTVLFSKASGAALLLGGLLLAGHGDFSLHALSGTGGAREEAAYTLLLLGFAVKAGLVPVQVWLPSAYPAAPGPARALMAGAAVNVAFYGMWRVLQLLGAPPVWLTGLVLVLGGITAILGIVHAAVHADLLHLVAWSSVENAGIITVGFGAAMVGATVGSQQLEAAGLVAATAQTIAHALAKSLLFTSASAVEEGAGTTDLDRLRGIIHRMPFSGTGLLVGGLTLAGLPFTAGFASEWLTLEALMQQFRVSDVALQLCTAVAGALVALSIGIAGVAFVRLVGLNVFGPAAGTDGPPPEREHALPHRGATALLVLGCLAGAALAPVEVGFVADGLRPLVGDTARAALGSSWTLQPVFPEFSSLSPSWLWIVIPAYALLVGLVILAASGRGFLRVRRVPAWASASHGADGAHGYTSFGYANPVRRILANLLLTRSELTREPAAPEQEEAFAPSGTVPGHARLGFSVDVVEVVERYLYRPLAAALAWTARQARRLQSGRLDAYMAYMFLTLLAVIALIALSPSPSP